MKSAFAMLNYYDEHDNYKYTVFDLQNYFKDKTNWRKGRDKK